MDKNQFGASAHGLVHACYECYGADNAQRLLTIFTRLTTIFLQYHGFTCGLDDCLLKPSTDEQLMQQFTLANTKNEEATIKFAKEHTSSANTSNNNISETLAQALMNKNNYRKFDSAVKKELNEITSKVIKLSIPSGQYKTFPKNCLTLMTESGAKGSLVNASQISCCLGLQEFEGKRIRHSATGKTLPVFEEFDTSAMAGGYVSGRFLTGITPQEFFFHTMGGREGLIDTAVKTARSGYLQRSMVKMMEGLYTTYDYTVRDTDKSVVQFFYGEDGVDPSKASFMDQFKFLAMNSKALCQKYRIEDVAEAFDVDGSAHKSVNKHMKRLLKRSKGKYNDLSNPIDPVMNRYDPMHHVGSISEKYAMQIADYCKRNPDHMLQSDKDDDDDENDASKLTQDLFKAIAHLKFMRSFAEPGDAVGVLAAQGVGEPSTQMTLNTFHFAGLDMAHVTVGIPRLVELLMTGSIKAPLMSIPASSKCTVAQGEKSAYQLSELKLKDILQQLNISEELLHSNNSYVSVFTVKMKFDTKLLSKVFLVYILYIVRLPECIGNALSSHHSSCPCWPCCIHKARPVVVSTTLYKRVCKKKCWNNIAKTRIAMTMMNLMTPLNMTTMMKMMTMTMRMTTMTRRRRRRRRSNVPPPKKPHLPMKLLRVWTSMLAICDPVASLKVVWNCKLKWIMPRIVSF